MITAKVRIEFDYSNILENECKLHMLRIAEKAMRLGGKIEMGGPLQKILVVELLDSGEGDCSVIPGKIEALWDQL